MTIEKIYKIHLKQLKNLDVPHKKLMIFFSGIPGSGKTYISKVIEKRYKAVRIRTDSIRKIIWKLGIREENKKEFLLDKYCLWLLSNWSFANKFIILDKGIDRDYDKISNLAKDNKYEIFLIRLKVPKNVLDKRIFKKKNKRDPHFDSEIGRWTNEWEHFGKRIKPDIVIENENKLDLKPLFLKLDKLS